MTLPPITHDVEHSRFTAQTEFGEAALEYMRDKKRMIFTHTGVPPEAEGQGIGAALARSALAQRKRASAVWLPMLAGLVGALVFLLIAAAPLASLVARFVRL